MANPSWFNEVEYLNGKLVQLNANGFKDANGNAFTSISQVADAITAGGMNVFEHYNAYGSAEGISPSNAFNAIEYCTFKLNSLRTTGSDAQKAEWAGKGWQDVQYAIHKGGMSLGEHYSEYGFVEGVPMSNAFDGNKYLEAKLAKLQGDEATSTQWTDKDVPALAAFFKANGTDPYTHYLTYGGRDGEVELGLDFKPEQIVPGGGVTEVLTTGVDNLIAGSNDTTFVAAQGEMGRNTFTAGDRLAGGAGNDTLILDNQGSVLAGAQTVSGIENVVVYDSNTTADTLDMSQFAGMKSLNYTGADAVNFKGVATVTDVTLNGASGGTTLEGAGIANLSLKNMAATADAMVTVHNSTADHALKVTLENVGRVVNTTVNKLQLVDATAKSLDIVSNGDANFMALGTTARNTKLETVAITGKADLTLDMNGDTVAGVKSIDGSKAEGDLNISNVGAATNSILTGAGNDTITMNDGAFGANDKFEMGEGEDTLMLTGLDMFTDKNAAHMKGILASTGIDTLGSIVGLQASAWVSNASGAKGADDVSVNMGLFKGTDIDTFTLQGAGDGTSGYFGQNGGNAAAANTFGANGGSAFKFISNTSTLEIMNAEDDALLFTGGVGGTGSGSNQGSGAGGLGGNGIEIVQFGANTNDDVATLSFAGSAKILGGAGGTGGASGNGGNGGIGLEASTIDDLNLVFSDAAASVVFAGGSGGTSGADGASGATGVSINIAAKGTINIDGTAGKVDLGLVQAGGNSTAGGAADTTIDASGLTAGKIKVMTSDGNDSLTGSDGDDILAGGLSCAGGTNTFTGGKGADYFVVGASGNTANKTVVTDVITDFTHGVDKIAFNVASINGALANVTKSDTAHSTLAALLTAADTAMGAAGIYIGNTTDGTVYVVGFQADNGKTDVIRLDNIALAGIDGTDFAAAAPSWA